MKKLDIYWTEFYHRRNSKCQQKKNMKKYSKSLAIK
jgi:hypothetical protein